MVTGYTLTLGTSQQGVPTNIAVFWNGTWNVYLRHYAKEWYS